MGQFHIDGTTQLNINEAKARIYRIVHCALWLRLSLANPKFYNIPFLLESIAVSAIILNIQ